MRFTPDQIRAALAPSEIAATVRYVRERRCNCCGAQWGDEIEMDCGHLVCERCLANEHECVACALVV